MYIKIFGNGNKKVSCTLLYACTLVRQIYNMSVRTIINMLLLHIGIFQYVTYLPLFSVFYLRYSSRLL